MTNKKIMDSNPPANIEQFELMPKEMAAVLSEWVTSCAISMTDKKVTYFMNLSLRLERTDDGIWAYRQTSGGIWTSTEDIERKKQKELQDAQKRREELIDLIMETRRVMNELEGKEMEFDSND